MGERKLDGLGDELRGDNDDDDSDTGEDGDPESVSRHGTDFEGLGKALANPDISDEQNEE